MFSFGTLTFVNLIMPFSIALSPMNRQRCSTSTPGQFASTMNAVICRRGLPFTTRSGVRAITTNSSAQVPLVVHSFSPFSTQCEPSSLGSACDARLAGSEPTSTSVSANAEMAPLASRG